MNLNISIDDVSPHPQSSTKVLDRCFSLIEKFPNIKFTLFVPLAYWRRRPGIATTKPLLLSEHPEFCNEIKSLPSKNFQIGYHSYYHGCSPQNDNDEFRDLSYEDAVNKFDLMFSESEKSGLKDSFSPIFRPPAWRMSEGAFQASLDCGIKTLALFSKDESLQDKYRIYYPIEDLYDKYNIHHSSCFPPLVELFVSDDANIVYHACEWDVNYLSEDLLNKVENFISENLQSIKFKFI
jgi:predicted deacetylase